MKEIVVSAIFLILELGFLLVSACMGALDWKAVILLVLIAKNVYVLYSAIKKEM